MSELFRKYMKNELTTHFGQNLTMGLYRVEFNALGVSKKHVKYVVHFSKRKD
jgi:hypothetical protein